MGLIKENLSMLSSPLFLILHNLIKPMILSADKTLLFLSHRYKVLHLLRCLVASFFVFLLHVVDSLPFSSKVADYKHYHYRYGEQQLVNSSAIDRGGGTGDTVFARAIHQLLSLVNSIPTSSRKYQLVRSLVEKLIDENNLEERSDALRQINCVVLSEAFGKTLLQLEAALMNQEGSVGAGPEPGGFGIRKVVKAAAKEWCWGKEGDGPAAEKMAAELLWLAQKMAESGGADVVLEKWGLAKNLGWLALAAETRVQASLVRLTAFLIKHAKELGIEQQTKGDETEQQKQTKVRMLMTWLPLLCRASNGADTPTLSTSEQREIERSLEDIINKIVEAENQEKVLSLWVHHFAQCSSSDWPNLYSTYLRWCNSSREVLLAEG